jgi:hypothetical protein
MRRGATGAVGELDVLLDEVPAARAHHDRGRALGRDAYSLPSGLVYDSCPRIASYSDSWPSMTLRQVGLVASSWSASHTRAGVQRVDRHLRVGGAGDLDAAVLEAGARAGDPPLGVFADVRGVGAELRVVAVADLEAAAHAVGEPVVTAARETRVQLREEREASGVRISS